MRKILIKMLTLILGLLLATNSIAGNNIASVSVQSVQDALQARNAMLGQPKLASTQEVGSDTYIVVINYTNDTIFATFPTQQIQLTRLTAGRYQRGSYRGPSHIELANANGITFWSGNVGYQDLISVYVSNGQYVVYDTH